MSIGITPVFQNVDYPVSFLLFIFFFIFLEREGFFGGIPFPHDFFEGNLQYFGFGLLLLSPVVIFSAFCRFHASSGFFNVLSAFTLSYFSV